MKVDIIVFACLCVLVLLLLSMLTAEAPPGPERDENISPSMAGPERNDSEKGREPSESADPVGMNESIKHCEKDDECVAVSDGCCGCAAGGAETAINKAHLDWWGAKRASSCAGFDCPAVMSQHISCFSHPECVNGSCEMVPVWDDICLSLLHENCKVDPDFGESGRGIGINCSDLLEGCDISVTSTVKPL